MTYAYFGAWAANSPAAGTYEAGFKDYKVLRTKGLGGTFFWEPSGDTSNGELIRAIK